MTAVRLIVRSPRGLFGRWLPTAGASVLLHVTLTLVVLFAPQMFRSSVRFPPVYTVDLVSLPAGAPGPPPAASAAAAPPAANPAPPAARPEPAVKIPQVPPAPPKVKPPKKAEPTKPKEVKPVEKPSRPETKSETRTESSAPSPGAAEATKPPATAAPGAGGSGSGGPAGGGGGGGGESLLVGDASFEYGWYLARMQSLIEGNWSKPIIADLSEPIRAGIRFLIRRDGSLSGVELAQGSGNASLDRSALRAVNDSNPLPPLPYQYTHDSLEITLFFKLNPE